MTLKNIFLRYGVFAVLILMTIGLYFLLQILSIRQKTPGCSPVLLSRAHW